MAIFCLSGSVYAGVRSYRAWRDPEGTLAYFLGGGYDERAAQNQALLSKVIGPIFALAFGVTGVAKAFNFFACTSSPQLRATLSGLFWPLAVIAFPGTLTASLAVAVIAFFFMRGVRGWTRAAYALYLAAFAFAALQGAGYHVGPMAERWFAVAGVIVGLAALTRLGWAWVSRRRANAS